MKIPAGASSACPTTCAELAHAQRSGRRGWSGGAGISSRGDVWPVLSEDACSELAAAYQTGLASGGREARELGAWAAEALCGSMFRLVQKICSEQGQTTRNETEDLNSVAMAALLEAAGEFDPERHTSFAPWAAGRIRKVISAEVATDTDWSVPPSWRKVGRTAWGALRNWENEHGTSPSLDQLRRLTRDLMVERAEQSAAARNPDADAATISEDVRRSMSKHGINAALARLDEAMASVQSGTSLQSLRGGGDDSEGQELIDTIGGGEDVEELALAQQERADQRAALNVAAGVERGLREAVLAYLGGSQLSHHGEDEDGCAPEAEATYESVARAYQVDVARLRLAVRHARSRISAPHAMYAHLSPDAPAMLENSGHRRYGDLLG